MFPLWTWILILMILSIILIITLIGYLCYRRRSVSKIDLSLALDELAAKKERREPLLSRGMRDDDIGHELIA
jgi:hypothetical protein